MRVIAPPVRGPQMSIHGTIAGLVLVCAAMTPGPARAQDSNGTEIGASAGVTITSRGGSSDPLFLFSPMVYATFFASPRVMVEPQISLSSTSGSGSSFTYLTLAGQVGYRFRPTGTTSPYLAASGVFQRVSGGGASVSGPGLGLELGCRFIVGSALGIRMNGRYRQWFADFESTADIGFGVAFGAIL